MTTAVAATAGSGLRRERARKVFHVASVALPVLAWLLPHAITVIGLTAVAAVAIVVDAMRLRLRPARYLFLRRTRTMLRVHERHRVTGATYMAVAYAAAALLFPLPVAVAAMLYNGLGDATAALVGKRYGHWRTRWGKSWEGFAAGLAVDLAVGLAVPGISLSGALAGAVVAATIEFLPLPLDDNLRVTIGGGVGILIGEMVTVAVTVTR